MAVQVDKNSQNLIERLRPETVIPGHGRVFLYTPALLAQARQRLDFFTANPLKHARHAVKVLIKFKLLEVQRQTTVELNRWALATPCFEQIRNRFFASTPWEVWLDELCAELVALGVAKKEGAYLLNA